MRLITTGLQDIESGQCHGSVCPDCQRQDCWFYCSRKATRLDALLLVSTQGIKGRLNKQCKWNGEEVGRLYSRSKTKKFLKKILRLTTKNTLTGVLLSPWADVLDIIIKTMTITNKIYIIVSPSFSVNNTIQIIKIKCGF